MRGWLLVNLGRFRATMMILGVGLLYVLLPAWAHHFDKILDRAVQEYEGKLGVAPQR